MKSMSLQMATPTRSAVCERKVKEVPGVSFDSNGGSKVLLVISGDRLIRCVNARLIKGVCRDHMHQPYNQSRAGVVGDRLEHGIRGFRIGVKQHTRLLRHYDDSHALTAEFLCLL